MIFRIPRKISFLIVSALLVVPRPSYALDLVEFATVGIEAPSSQNFQGTQGSASLGFSYGVGLALGFHFMEGWAFEPAFLYFSRSFSLAAGTNPTTDFNVATLQVPVVIRHWLTPAFSVGLGGFISQTTGNLTLVRSGIKTITDANGAQIIKNDTGLAFSFRYQTPINEAIKLILEERILWGLSNQDGTGIGSLSYRDFQSWIGVGFNL